MEKQILPVPELKHLDFLVGKWQTSGTIKATTDNPAQEIKGTDSYEWALDGHFLLHQVEVLMGEEKTLTIELIGSYDAANKTYAMRSFDNQGNFATMQASIEREGVMKITGDKMRSTLSASKDGQQMQAHWERSEDGTTWVPWMDMQFSK